MNEDRPPVLIVAFELERQPRALNASDLSEGDLIRIVDWLVSHDLGLDLDTWLERRLERKQAA